MEISADYAPGGSGCGIFNSNHELIGLVSIIQYGDGPSLAEGFGENGLSEDGWDEQYSDGEDGEESNEDYGDFDENGMLLVKHAVPLSAIQSLWTKEQPNEKTDSKLVEPNTEARPTK